MKSLTVENKMMKINLPLECELEELIVRNCTPATYPYPDNAFHFSRAQKLKRIQMFDLKSAVYKSHIDQEDHEQFYYTNFQQDRDLCAVYNSAVHVNLAIGHLKVLIIQNCDMQLLVGSEIIMDDVYLYNNKVKFGFENHYEKLKSTATRCHEGEVPPEMMDCIQFVFAANAKFAHDMSYPAYELDY